MSRRYNGYPGVGGWLVGIILVVVLVIAATYTFSAWKDVDPGYVGVRFNKSNGTVTADNLKPGWYFINPFAEALVQYPITSRTLSMSLDNKPDGSVERDDAVIVQDVEGQRLKLDVVVMYHANPSKVGELYKKFGGANIDVVETRVVREQTRSVVPEVSAKVGWEEINSNRAVIADQAEALLRPVLEANFIELESLTIREIDIPDNLDAVIAAKIQKQQEIQQAESVAKQKAIENEQRVAESVANATIAKNNAEADAQAILARAKAQAEANRLLAQSVSPELVEYEKAKKWDGKLPQVTGGSTPMIPLNP